MSEFQNKFEGINFKPSEVMFPKYVLLDSYGKAEAEEAMARIITMLQQSDNEWHEIRYYDLMKLVNADVDAINAAVQIQNKNSALQMQYDRERRRLRNRLQSWWLGMEVVKEPKYETVPETPEHTLLLPFGAEAINIGLRHLLKNGLVDTRSDEEQYQYFAPTKKALDILQEKGFVASGDE